MKERTSPIINYSRLSDTPKLIMEKETLLGIMNEDKTKSHHSSAKPRKNFGGKPTVRKIQVTTPDSSDSNDTTDDQDHPQSDGDGEDEMYEA